MTDELEPENLCHLVDMQLKGANTPKIDMTMCGIPASECNWILTSEHIFTGLDMQDQCVLCEIEMKRRF